MKGRTETMKLIIALLRSEKLPAVQAALNQWDPYLMTVNEVLDCRRGQVVTEIYRGREVRRPVTRLRLEVAVDDSCFDDAVGAIDRACDGEVFVMGLDESTRVCACERDGQAVSFEEEDSADVGFVENPARQAYRSRPQPAR
jgi:nitrogen regulatory protein PII